MKGAVDTNAMRCESSPNGKVNSQFQKFKIKLNILI